MLSHEEMSGHRMAALLLVSSCCIALKIVRNVLNTPLTLLSLIRSCCYCHGDLKSSEVRETARHGYKELWMLLRQSLY